MKRNKIDEISFMGGLIGWLAVNPKDTINSRVAQANEYGWSVVNIVPGSDQNAFLRVLRLIVLILILVFRLSFLNTHYGNTRKLGSNGG